MLRETRESHHSCMRHTILTRYICLPNIIKISQRVLNIVCKLTPKGCKGEQPFLYVTHNFDMNHMSTKYTAQLKFSTGFNICPTLNNHETFYLMLSTCLGLPACAVLYVTTDQVISSLLVRSIAFYNLDVKLVRRNS